ncbi:MAG: hypothetical protein MZV70_15575 [Desulfobacterales bacterium]|nr:hypothetical protein [Desulfobacterales bacterium]
MKQRVTEFFLPPTVVYRLIDIPGIEKVDFSSVKYLMYGVGPHVGGKIEAGAQDFRADHDGSLWTNRSHGASLLFSSRRTLQRGPNGELKELADDSRLASSGRPTWSGRVEIMDDNKQHSSGGKNRRDLACSGDVIMNRIL